MRRLISSVAAVAVLGAAGCGGGESTETSFGSDIVKQVEVATRGGDFRGTVDAAPTPDGRTVYFTATGSTGPGLFRVPATGGTAEAVVTGAPFIKPVGVVVGMNGAQVFVADEQAGGGGAILAVATAGGSVTPVPGTEGTVPRGLELGEERDQQIIFFTGKDREGAPGVFKIPAAGASDPRTVVKNSPLIDPDAVAVTKSGVAYVTDRGAGAVFRVTDGSTERIAPLRAPRFAGVALTLDESTVLVSALSEEGTDEVVVIDTRTLRTGAFNKTISANRDGGGLHRAQDVNVFAWADFIAGPDRVGRVYVLRP